VQKKSNLVIDSASGDELENIALEMLKLDPATTSKLNEVLK
jgi:hypothetical protein